MRIVTGDTGSLAIAPDGQTLVFRGATAGVVQLFRRGMAEIDVIPLPDTVGAGSPFFSADGRSVGFVANGQIKRIGLAGGSAVTVGNLPPGGFFGATWGPDVTIVLGSFSAGLWTVSANGGTPVPLTTPDIARGELGHMHPVILPGGRAVLFTVWSGSFETLRIEAQSLDTGHRVFVADGGRAQYASSGHVVYAPIGFGEIWAVPFDTARLEVLGDAVPLRSNIRFSNNTTNYTLGADGTLVYVRGSTENPRRTLVWVDRNGVETPVVGLEPRAYESPTVSPDGRYIVVSLTGGGDLWRYDAEMEGEIRFTRSGKDFRPVYRPDGSAIAFGSTRRGGPENLYLKNADGSGEEVRLNESPRLYTPQSWSPDGKILLAATFGDDGLADIMALLVDAGLPVEPEPLLQTADHEYHPVVSPNGRWMAYTVRADRIFVRPYQNVASGSTYPIGRGSQPLWGLNGRELFFRTPDGITALPVETGETFAPTGRPQLLFPDGYHSSLSRNWVLSSDGRQFLLIKPDETTGETFGADEITVVLNLHEELKARVPVN